MVTEKNAKEQIERRMSDLSDLLALFLPRDIDDRAWRRLLVYCPRHVIDDLPAPSLTDALAQSRRVRNYSKPDEVFEAVPTTFLREGSEQAQSSSSSSSSAKPL